MLQSAIAYSKAGDSVEAGGSVGSQISQTLGGEAPDALVVFASPRYDHEKLLGAIHSACYPRIMVGCSSAGEFTNQGQGVGLVCAVALRSPEMQFAAGIGHNLRSDRVGAANEVISSFRGMSDNNYVYRCALVLTDALAGQVDDFVEYMTVLTGGTYQFFGGGAGDDDAFTCTNVFYDTQVATDAVVALEILSNKPIGIGVSHGWQPASAPMRVTESGRMRLVSVNAMPAAEMFEEHAEQTGQSFDRANPLPFFLHNVIGIRSDVGHHLRVPLSVDADGSVLCAADIPTGSTVQVMSIGDASAADAAALAVQSALRQIEGYTPKVALFFDCVATRLRMGKGFSTELDTLQSELGPTAFIGCNTYGQIARAEGEFSGFHNCTAVVCILPE